MKPDPLADSAATDRLSVTNSHPFSTGERTWDSCSLLAIIETGLSTESRNA